MHNKVREPLFHIVKRDALPWYRAWGIRALAIVLALLLCALITTLCTHLNPLKVFATMFSGAFGTPRKMWILGQNLAILLCISLAVTPDSQGYLSKWRSVERRNPHAHICQR